MHTQSIIPGLLLSVVIGILAMALDHYFGMPAMLMAVILGLAVSGLSRNEQLAPGLQWSAKYLLYFGVALLGLKIDLAILFGSGFFMPALAIGLVAFTILTGFWISKWLVKDSHFAILIATAVAVCGVSAAVALCSSLPNCKQRSSQLAVTIGGITVLSTLAMIVYPFISHGLRLNDTDNGLFLGGTIHNVSQAIGAGYSVNSAAGDTATLIKLIRVSMLLPVILIVSWIFARKSADTKVGWKIYFPPFLIAFAALALLRYYDLFPEFVIKNGSLASEFFLIVSLGAIGARTHLKDIIDVGIRPFIALLLTSIVIAGTALFAIALH